MQKKSHSKNDWSEWIWSPEYSQYYRYRYVHGQLEYAYDTSSQNVPRSAEEPVLDQLASDVGSLHLGSPSYEEHQHHQYSDQGTYPNDSTTQDHSTSPQYTHHPGYQQHGYAQTQSHSSSHRQPHSHSHSSSHTQPHSQLHSHSSIYTQPHSQSQSHSHSSKDKGKGKAKGKGVADAGHYNEDPIEEHDYTGPGPDSHAQTPSYNTGTQSYGDGEYYDEGDDAAMQQALEASRAEQYGHGHQGGGETSYSAGTYGGSTFDPGAYEPDSNPYPESDTTPRGSGTAGPSYGSGSGSRHSQSYTIHGTPGAVEQVDHRFVVEHSYKFQPGEVFKILWSEPMGQVSIDEPISDLHSMGGANGRFYVGYRRFIIVTTDESHHSTCVPILTYDRRGCLKKGVKEKKHGIVYATVNKPRTLKNEPRLGFDPVAVEMYAEGETLAKESRVNYSKLVTIEHNVKVFFIGRVISEHLDFVASAVNKCWEEKIHKSKKSKK